jgi:microcystin degradation protein MlrC
MTKAQLDLAHKTASELSMYAAAANQYGHSGMAAAMRNAASLLTKMVEEAEAPVMSNLDDEGRR